MFLDKFGAMKLARAIAKHTGLTIVFEAEPMPRTNGKQLFLELPKDFWGEAQWTQWWGCFYHEVGHNDPKMRDCFQLLKDKDIDCTKFFGMGINIIEDNRQERHNWDEFLGRRNALSRSHILSLKLGLAKKCFGRNPDMHRQAIEAVVIWDTWERSHWMMGMVGVWEQQFAMATAQSQEWATALMESRFVLKDTTDALSVYDMWRGILDEIFKFDANKEEEAGKNGNGKDKGSGEGEGAGEKGSGQDGEGDAKSGADGDGGKPGDRKGDDAGQTGDTTIDYTDLIKHIHDGEETTGSDTYRNLTIKYNQDDPRANWTSKDPQVTDLTKEKFDGTDSRYRVGILEAITCGRGLSATVRRLLQIRSRDRYQYGKKSGRLHGASLHRLGIKDGGRASTRVFKQKRVNECLDVSFTVLGDSSGSMGTSKYTSMAASMLLLDEAVRPLGIKYELMTFTDTSTTLIKLLKTFDSSVSQKDLLNSLIEAGRRKANNADGEAIMWAYSRLLQQKTARKVLIVLSDGQPASNRGDCKYHLEQVVKSIEKQGKVEIYAIGIETDTVELFYSNYQVIQDSSELESALLHLISTRIIR